METVPQNANSNQTADIYGWWWWTKKKHINRKWSYLPKSLYTSTEWNLRIRFDKSAKQHFIA